MVFLRKSCGVCKYTDILVDRVLSTMFTADARFVLSGSDDGNVRIWKAKAHEKLGIVTARERAAIEYRDSLKDKWKMDTQVNKVSRYALNYSGFSDSLLNARDCTQDPPYTETSIQGCRTQEDHVGRSTCQGGEKKKTHEGGREQTQGREKENRCGRADLSGTALFLSFSRHAILMVVFAYGCTILCNSYFPVALSEFSPKV